MKNEKKSGKEGQQNVEIFIEIRTRVFQNFKVR